MKLKKAFQKFLQAEAKSFELCLFSFGNLFIVLLVTTDCEFKQWQSLTHTYNIPTYHKALCDYYAYTSNYICTL